MTGMGAVTALGSSVPEFLAGLRHGSTGIRLHRFWQTAAEVPLARVEIADTPLPNRFEAFADDRPPLVRLVLPALEEALRSASITDRGPLRSTALVIGTTVGGVHALADFVVAPTAEAATRLVETWPSSALPARLADVLGIDGPCMTTGAACAAGAQAIVIATQLIRTGRVSRAVVGGYDPLSPYTVAGFSALRAMSRGVIRPFDRERDGLALGEGAGFMVLEDLHAAAVEGRVLAEIAGVGQSCDAYHLTSPDPAGAGLERAIRAALADAQAPQETIGYINAHGTGTRLNDSSECAALDRVFRAAERRLPISSIKAAIGHTLGAAGTLETIATVGALRSGFLPPTLNHVNTDPECDIDCVPNTSRDCRINRAMTVSAGFGGVTAAILVHVDA